MCGARPDEDGWLTVQVAALHGYLLDLSEPDVADQADEISALIPAIVAQLHQDGDTVLALETAYRLPPFDSVAPLGATCEPARPSRGAAARAADLRPARSPASGHGPTKPNRRRSNIPDTAGWPAAGTLSITASWPGPCDS